MEVFFVIIFTLLTLLALAGLVYKTKLYFARAKAVKESGVLNSAAKGTQQEGKK